MLVRLCTPIIQLNEATSFVMTFRPDFTSKLIHVLAFGTPKFYIAPYDKIKRELVNLSSNCDVKSGLRMPATKPSFSSLNQSLHQLSCIYPKTQF